MIEDGKSFDKMLNIALDYQQHEISEYLKSNFGQTHNSIAESMYFGNYDVASYLLSNGADINDIYISIHFISIIVLLHFLYFIIIHYFIGFSLLLSPMNPH